MPRWGSVLARWQACILGSAIAVSLEISGLALAQTSDPADLIRAIRVEGNQRIESATVISYMKLVTGDRFDNIRTNESLKSLFGTGLFADVKLVREGSTLIVHVIENPIVNRLAFEGNRRIKDDVLSGEVQLRPRTVYTRTRVQSDVARLRDVYRRSGRFAATIEPKVVQQAQNRVDLIFEINEGALSGVQRIVFIGNKNFSDSTLREVIESKQTRWWRFFSSSDSYDPDRLSFDRELLRRFYLKEGFADFHVTGAVAELAPDRSNFFVTFTIGEGERYRFGNVNLVNELLEFDVATIENDVGTETGDWYNAEAVEETIEDLTEEIGSQGFAFVDIQPDVVRRHDDLTIDVDYRIREGDRVYVQRIDITGNVRTLDRIIRRNVRLAEGDAFNTARIRRSRTLIQNLGFFSRVDINDQPGDAPDQAVINVDVEEQSTGEVTFGGGFSSTEGPTGSIGVRERNLLGRGQDISLQFVISAVTQDLDFSFTEPYFLNREFAAGFDIFRREREYQNSAFNKRDVGFALRSGYPLAEYLLQTLRYTLANEEIIADSDASATVKEQAGESLISRLNQTLMYDRRNRNVDPTEGYFARMSTSLAGIGGDKNYFSQSAGVGYYYTPWDDLTASSLAEFAYIFPTTGDNIEVGERFFLGGNSFRGFAPSGVGPRDLSVDSAVGGNLMYKGTLELGFPIGLPNELGIKGRVFSIAGSLTEVDNAASTVSDTGSLRVSMGAGLSWASPFGPVRIDITKAVVKESFDDTEILSFGFGSVF
ncbi:MAG: outer membrane protein assembly factor BamA [Alphaproteobacteria bacterium]|nr:outer membrane protein assembly factor BamA [Alphaproteobacteria bacterium]